MTLLLCGLFALVIGGIAALVMFFGSAGGVSAAETGAGGEVSANSPVPTWLRPLLEQGAKECPQVTPSVLGAQLYAESRFDPRARSPVGARGLAQFMPATWATWGQDGDGDGKQDIFNPRDAVPAQAKYDCALAKDTKGVGGDSMENMLAAYNAGPGAVLKYRGIPPYSETRTYVGKIRDLAEKWASAESSGPTSGGKGTQKVVAAAKSALGTWYRWGGTCSAPFKGEASCDCSSLMKMAWSAGGVNLPRVTDKQVKSGKPVQSISQLRPGDLLFSVGSAEYPEHVGMYVGNSQVIDAPHTGAKTRIKPLSYWTPQIVAMRHIS